MGEGGSATPRLNAHGHGAPLHRPEDSVYYHPQLNPTGVPPPGKPARYRSAPQIEAAAGATHSLPPCMARTASGQQDSSRRGSSRTSDPLCYPFSTQMRSLRLLSTPADSASIT